MLDTILTFILNVIVSPWFNRYLSCCNMYITQCTLLRNCREHETENLVCSWFWNAISQIFNESLVILSFPFRRSSVGTFIRQQPLTSSGSSSVDSNRSNKTLATAPRLDYRSMVSVEDMPELFVSFDSKCPGTRSVSSWNTIYFNLYIYIYIYLFGMINSMIVRYTVADSAHAKYLFQSFTGCFVLLVDRFKEMIISVME